VDCINVLIADDHPIFLSGIRGILARNASIRIVAEANSAEQMLAQVEMQSPHLIISDAHMPPADMATTVCTIKGQFSDIHILMISAYDNDERLFGLLNAGISGYMLKEDTPELLLQAIREIEQGGMWFSPRLLRRVLIPVFTQRHISAADNAIVSTLSKREQEVLALVSKGLENWEIADQLCITKRTVQNHVSTIYQKLCVKSRSQAVLYAIRKGLVNP
jgi:DNA-binding NarL/FixJ family response regulator